MSEYPMPRRCDPSPTPLDWVVGLLLFAWLIAALLATACQSPQPDLVARGTATPTTLATPVPEHESSAATATSARGTSTATVAPPPAPWEPIGTPTATALPRQSQLPHQ